MKYNNYSIKKYVLLGLLVASISMSQVKAVSVGAFSFGKNARAYVEEIFATGRLSYGPFLKKMESMFGDMHDSLFCVSSNSGTSSLQVALQALKEIHGWADGDEVIVPAVTFVATANIVIHCRMVPVFVDVEPDYYELDPSKIEEKITSKTRCLIPVHLFGQPCDMDPIIAIAEKYNLKIIEDSCETMYARYKGRSVGTLGDIGCFSTYVAHLLVTGVGGLGTTNNPEYAVKMRSLVNHGRDSIYINIDDDKGLTKEEMKEVVGRRFNFISIGHSFRLTEFEGALGVAQLEELEEIVMARRKNAAYLTEKLQELQDVLQLPAIRPETEHSFMMYPIVLKYESKINCVNYLEQRGIETRDMLPLINQPIYKNLFNIRQEDYPVADWINKNGFYVGCHQQLTELDMDEIVAELKKYFGRS